MTTLVITRGYPGAGKSTWARSWVAEQPEKRARANRDDLRRCMFGTGRGLTHKQEKMVTTAQHAMVRALLASGRDVVVDDTNLKLRTARSWADMAVETGADFTVIDLQVALDVCLAQDVDRDHPVGEDVLRRFARRYPMPWPEVKPSERQAAQAPAFYTPPEDKPTAWLVDVDGTLALMGDRSPYDTTTVRQDRPSERIIDLARMLYMAGGHQLVIMSGRTEECRADTEDWLDQHLGVHMWAELHMRAKDDKRPDYLVKAELFDKHVRDRWNIRGVLDDRDQVVKMWRSMGLTCLQVAEGAF